jgi:hypothetical protein
MNIVRVISLTTVFTALVVPMASMADDGQTNAGPGNGGQATAGQVNATVDFAKSAGKIRALHGVNNGPVSWGISADLTNYYKDAGFPSARLHDCHYASANVVDIHFIFPIFDADADDPKYYQFAETDAYLAPIVNNGTQITYRLGESIECRSRAYSNGGFYVQPPKDFAKWAKICVNIIRHYNEGWANGFHYNIKHWEIWNEPSEKCNGMWPGTLQQYYELYETAARAIKAHDSSLKVGGPAVCNIGFADVIRPFLAHCRDRKVPLDFVSWHCYPATPQEVARDAMTARKLIDEYGFKDAESHITEWHPMWYPWENSIDANELGNPNPQKYATMREKFDTMRGPKAAAYVASALMLLQDSPLDMANYYTADTNPWGMFDLFGIPGRVYYSFVAFNQLTKTPNRVSCEQQGTPQAEIALCAGLSDDRQNASILVSNFSAAPRKVILRLQNLPLPQPTQVETLAIDAAHEFSSLGKAGWKSDDSTLTLDLPENGVCFVRLGAAAK